MKGLALVALVALTAGCPSRGELRAPSEERAGTPIIALFTPLELAGRDIYVREGCYCCHAIALGRPDGPSDPPRDVAVPAPSIAEGSRIDLSRRGAEHTALWHLRHLREPRSVRPRSIMPQYPWLLDETIDPASAAERVRAQRDKDPAYGAADVAAAAASHERQARYLADELEQAGELVPWRAEVIALIAFLKAQRPGGRRLVPHGTSP